MSKIENHIKRLEYLKSLFKTYYKRYHETVDSGLSSRFYSWIDEYNAIRENNTEAWNIYCDKHDLCKTHKAYDCFA